MIAEFYNKEAFIQASSSHDYLDTLMGIIGVPNNNIRELVKNKSFLKYMD